MKNISYSVSTYMVNLLFIIAVLPLLSAVPVSARESGKTEMGSRESPNDAKNLLHVQKVYGKLPLYFIQNNGHMDERIRFYERGGGHVTFFTDRGIYLSLINSQTSADMGQKQGAWDKGQEGISQLSGKSRFMTAINHAHDNKQATIDTISRNKVSQGNKLNPQTGNPKLHNPQSKIPNQKSEIVKLIPIGANKSPEIIAENIQEGKINYFTGNDPDKWKANIPTYSAIVYKEIYKDIDIKFYGNNRQMEYDIIVKPGANPSRVRFAYSGIEDLRITDEGDLEIRLKGGKLIQKKPYIYQEMDGKRVKVDGRFKIYDTGKQRSEVRNRKSDSGTQIADCQLSDPKPRNPNSKIVSISQSEFGSSNSKSKIRNQKCIYGFQVASYDKRYPLIIDPTLIYSTYLGGSSVDYGYGIAVDPSGSAYITGYTFSTDFPNVSAILENSTGIDAFVTKLNASGSGIVYSTYLGGSNDEFGFGIATDTSGNAYVTGYTFSDDFPTVSAISENNAGGNDAFITKLNTTGSSLVYSTYLGGSSDEFGLGIATDTSGNAYVTGYTFSDDFPTASAISGSNAGDNDAFVTKINASGNGIVYSTYLGGSSSDVCNGIAVDTSGNAYVAGQTNSTDFPVASAIYESNTGFFDAFVTKINPSGSALVYSTYLGGSSNDACNGIAVDTSGNAYVTGQTASTDFPVASAIYGNNTGFFDAFITKINPSGSGLVYSTYLGGSNDEFGHGIAIGTSGNVYITGDTYSADFPTISAIYGNNAGSIDAYVTKLNASGNTLAYSTYLGGSSDESSLGIAVDIFGNAYVTGQTDSTDFPVASAMYGSNTGLFDAFITKIASDTIFGYVVNNKDKPVKSAKVRLRGENTKTSGSTSSDNTGFFQFGELDADTYTVFAKKKGYKKAKQKVTLEEGEAKEIELKMKKN